MTTSRTVSIGSMASLVGLILCLPSSPVLAAGMFPAAAYEGGILPQDVQTGDFDKDGIVDLAILSQGQSGYGPAQFRVLLGNGDGTFRPMPPIDLAGFSGVKLYVADVNGDGKPDAVAEMGGRLPLATHVLLGRGDGTFMAAPDVPHTVDEQRNVLADFTGDSKPDLMLIRGITNSTSSSIEVLRGVGDGTFVPQPPGQVAEQSMVYPFLIGDLNNDGRIDLVSGAGSLGVRTFVSNGDGSFQPHLTNASAKMQAGVLVDMDRDGFLDLVITGDVNGTSLLQLFRGSGTGFFASTASWTVTSPPLGSVVNLSAGDINADGWPDLVVTSNAMESAYFGHAGGTVSLHQTFSLGDLPFRTVLGNFDGQNGMDLAQTALFSFTAYVLLSDKDGNLGHLTPNPIPLPFGTESRAAVLADFNRDGIPDLVGMSCSGQGFCTQVGMAPGQPGGFFGATTLYTAGNHPTAIVAADVNGDGNPDLLVTNDESDSDFVSKGTLSVFIGLGNGTFLPQTKYEVGYFPKAVQAGDLDGDGDLDVVVVNPGNPTDGYPADMSVFKNNGNGTLAPAQSILSGFQPRDIEIGDFDGDGRADLATVSKGFYPSIPAEVDIRRGLGDGTFAPPQAVGYGRAFKSLAAGDLDSDGDLDIVVVDEGDIIGSTDPGRSIVLLNQGGLSFTASATLTGGYNPQDGHIQDVNQDGLDDIWVDNATSYDVIIFPGKGDGSYGAGERYAALGFLPLLIGQFDGDSRPDLIVADTFETFAVLNISATTLSIRVGPSRDVIAWTGVPFSPGYDLVKGSLAALRTGGFHAAVTACLQSNKTDQSVIDPAVPSVGQGFFYLARPRKVTGDPGSYDGEAGQVAPRDTAIDSSSLACP